MKDNSLYDFIYVKFQKSPNYSNRKQITDCKELELVGGPQQKVTRKHFRAMEMFCVWMLVVGM